MLRTIVWFIYFWLYLLATLPALLKVNMLTKKDKIAERNKIVNKIVQHWAKSLVNLTGSDIRVRGGENIPQQGPVLFVGNHQGNFDIPILLGFVNKPKAFIAKAELTKFPIINYWMKYMNCIFLKRDNAREALKAISQGVEVLQNGYSLVIFPEGTRSQDGSLGEFKSGSLKLATKARVPVIPITIKGSYQIMPKGSWFIRPAQVEVIISPVISKETVVCTDAKDLTELVRKEIAKNL